MEVEGGEGRWGGGERREADEKKGKGWKGIMYVGWQDTGGAVGLLEHKPR